MRKHEPDPAKKPAQAGRKKGKEPAQEPDPFNLTYSLPVSGGWEWDLAADRMEWSERFFRIIGHSEKSLAPSLDTFLRIVHPSDRALVKAKMEETTAHKGPLRMEFRVVTSQGNENHVRMRGEALGEEGGKPGRVVGLIQQVTSEMMASEATKKSEQRLSFHRENTPMAVIEWDTDFNVVEWNNAAERIFGYTKAQAIGRNAMDLVVPPQARPAVAEVWRNLLAKKGGERSLNANITGDGRTIMCEWYNTPIVSMEGEVVQVVSMAQDVTEREEARRALRESEERHRLLVEMSPVAIAVHSQGRLVYINPACTAMFGLQDAVKAIGRPVLDFVAKEYHDVVKNRIRSMLVEGIKVPPMEEKFVKEDGTPLDVEVTAAPLTYHGQPAVMAVFRDVSESKRTQIRLKAANDFLQAVMDAMPNPVYHKDVNGVFIGCNKALEKYVGLRKEDIIGKTVQGLSNSGEAAKPHIEKDLELMQKGGEQTYETIIPVHGGETRNVRINKACYYNPDGTLGGIVGIISDITDLKKIQKDLTEAKNAAEKANMAKTTFLSSISHEVRTPLNSVIGFASLLSTDEASPFNKTHLDYLGRIKSSGEHLLSLFDEILDLSRIESGTVAIPATEVDLGEAALLALSSVSDMASRHGVRLLGPAVLEEFTIMGDLGRLTQIFSQLLSNGIKFNRRGGEVSLSYRREGGEKVRITVADNGQGVPPDKVDMLFEPFERLGVEGLNIKGAGVGLTLVKKLAAMMKGAVEVESKLGAGSKFHVIFPLAGPSPAVEPPAPTAGSANRIMVVEDNPDNMELMKLLLEKNTGYQVVCATQAPSAIEMARSISPALILMDINLPGMDGYEALRLLRGFKETCSVPVVAVSASASPNDVKRGLAAGFTKYITKPIVSKLFIREVLDTIKSHSAPPKENV